MTDFPSISIDEPLEDSARLAKHWSRTLCQGCESYHGAWQLLRLLGALNSMRSDDDFLLSSLDSEIRNGARRILVSGAADYAMQARIITVARQYKVNPQITVIDLCKTPLKLNNWYAGRQGVDIETVEGDVLEHRRPGYYDLVCTHSFLPFFKPSERSELIGRWWECLADSGAVLTAQRVRPGEKSDLHGFSKAQSENFAGRAKRLAKRQFDSLGIDPDKAHEFAYGYAAGRSTHTLRSRTELKQLFENQGFQLDWFAAPGEQQAEQDMPSTPTAPGDQRIRILARKPGERAD